MAVRCQADMRRRRKTLIDSGCNRSIFTNRSLFLDFYECLIPITSAGEEIYATGMGTVANLKGCLYVPDMNVNLISVMHVLDDFPNVSITFEKPNGVGICIILTSFNSSMRSTSNPKTDCSRCRTTHGSVFSIWMTMSYGNNITSRPTRCEQVTLLGSLCKKWKRRWRYSSVSWAVTG